MPAPPTGRLTETLYTMQDVANMLRLKLVTVRNWQTTGNGPVRLKIGASVRYRLDDVISWTQAKEESGNRNYRMSDILAWIEQNEVKSGESE